MGNNVTISTLHYWELKLLNNVLGNYRSCVPLPPFRLGPLLLRYRCQWGADRTPDVVQRDRAGGEQDNGHPQVAGESTQAVHALPCEGHAPPGEDRGEAVLND